MKLTVSTILAFTMLLFWQFTPVNTFEGVVEYQIEYVKIPAEFEMLKPMLSTTQTLSIKGNMKKQVQNNEAGNVVIFDGTSTTLLMDIDGKKIKKTVTAEDREKKPRPNYTYTYKDTTKAIAGYQCKLAVLTDAQEMEFEVWYTEKIDAPKSAHPVNYAELKGFPMEYSLEVDGLRQRFTATSVNTGTVNDSEFSLPEGYSELGGQ